LTRFVLIVQDIDPQPVRALSDAVTGQEGPDRPDRAALLDNPRVPFGGLDR
jgi:hypothetical protein